MTGAADRLVERAADGLQGRGLVEDADFLRKLKPSLVLARARGRTGTGAPANGGRPEQPARPRPRPKTGRAPNPLVVVGVAFAVGLVVAKLIDSRGHGR